MVRRGRARAQPDRRVAGAAARPSPDLARSPAHLARPPGAPQTFDDALLELHHDNIDIFSVAYQKPKEGALSKLAAADALLGQELAGRRAGWGARVLHAMLGGPVAGGPYPQRGEGARLHDARYDPSLT